MLDPTGKRSLWVFEALAHCRHRYGTDAIGPYVVSAARGVDDMLSVLLLARWADTTDSRSGDVPTDVAPLFESAAALRACGEIMTQVFNEPAYRKHLIGRANHQYVMIGYSASNKDSGIVMSRWLLRKRRRRCLLRRMLPASISRCSTARATAAFAAADAPKCWFAAGRTVRAADGCASPNRASSSTRNTVCARSRCACSSRPSTR